MVKNQKNMSKNNIGKQEKFRQKETGQVKNLAIIPARSGSKGIPKKNIKIFCGKPLIAHSIEQAKNAGVFDRIIVDTDSAQIAKIARRFGAETPFLRPKKLAGDNAQVSEAVLLLLKRLKEKEDYQPDIITLLQTTSPLREIKDIKNCAKVMRDKKVVSVCTICETHHRLYRLSPENRLVLINKPNHDNQNRQAWPQNYILNGCMVYMVRTDKFLKDQKFVDEDTVGVICDKWRSVDLDRPEDWVIAETLYQNKKQIYDQIKRF